MAVLTGAARYDYLKTDTFRKRVAMTMRVVAVSMYQNNPPLNQQDKINEWAKAVLKSPLDIVNNLLVDQVIQALIGRAMESSIDDAATDQDFFDDISNSVEHIIFISGHTSVLPQ